MSIGYENRRDQFERIVKLYIEYVELYKFFNNGSSEGITPFEHFYWEQNFYAKHRARR